ncbi:MAG TPA: isocitrate/isopropylmalate dehydrogenase family protein [Thermodesulfobacteriota bacterium]|nr:isocitrate/isopropylmalate dehydrogenase family protein [Thermodesulfobacteriota bacterium]
MRSYRIAVIPGDGVGPEVVAEGLKALAALADAAGGALRFDLERFDWGSERYLRTGRMMPEDGLERLAQFDAVYLGAVGDPRVPDHVTLHGLLLPIKMGFDLYVGLRPVRLHAGVESALAGKAPGSIDIVLVRENTQGEYADIGGIVGSGEQALAVQSALFTQPGCARIVRYAFDHARAHGRRKVTSVTKSNAQRFGMVFWDRVFWEVAREYPDIQAESRLVDAAAMDVVRRPESFDVLVASNLFADILSDLVAAVTGGLGLAPGASFRPDRARPGLFDPVHGSAPDIAGRGLANPLAAILTAGLMLDYLGEGEAAERLRRAVAGCLAAREVRTPDLGGRSSTAQVGDEVARRIRAAA